ncbi:unnamed protein product [Citrullus colocynthis]|uniref:Uncharacterized protein n=1 Tax=Citrullus colocynthis TaxID=252529 RepID=A0ABP0Y5W2_9ROSI
MEEVSVEKSLLVTRDLSFALEFAERIRNELELIFSLAAARDSSARLESASAPSWLFVLRNKPAYRLLKIEECDIEMGHVARERGDKWRTLGIWLRNELIESSICCALNLVVLFEGYER